MEQSERAQLTLMVKWYFVAAGVAKDCVLKETKAYPKRLRYTLEYIAKRMNPIVVQRMDSEPVLSVGNGNRLEGGFDNDESVELGTTIPCFSCSPASSRTATPGPACETAEIANTQITPGIKCIAQDAGLAELAEKVAQAACEDQLIAEELEQIDSQV